MSDNRKPSANACPKCQPRSALGLALCILLGFAPAAVWAESAPTLRLVTGDNYAPFSDQNLPWGGLATHLVRYLFEQIDQAVEIDVTGWSTGYQAALDGDYAGTFPYIESQQRLNDYLYSGPLFTVSSYAYVDQSSTINASSPEDLAGLSLCLPEGFAHGPALNPLVESGSITRITPSDMPSCFAMLQSGEADFVKINRYVARELLRNAGVPHSAIRALPFPVETVSMHFIAPRNQNGSPALIARVNQALADLQQDNEYARFVDDYLTIIYPRQMPSSSAP
ncbi:MAG: transporter substrate-binding domain-containing protein [Saccharospirillum sp.]|uniref:substrate-binding periplasmic protein n=1 Tax=Saccharospirillum sp. TaxID=2033801 RepID=UPI00329A7131